MTFDNFVTHIYTIFLHRFQQHQQPCKKRFACQDSSNACLEHGGCVVFPFHISHQDSPNMCLEHGGCVVFPFHISHQDSPNMCLEHGGCFVFLLIGHLFQNVGNRLSVVRVFVLFLNSFLQQLGNTRCDGESVHEIYRFLLLSVLRFPCVVLSNQLVGFLHEWNRRVRGRERLTLFVGDNESVHRF